MSTLPPLPLTVSLSALLAALPACAGDDGDRDSAATLSPTGASGLATTVDMTTEGTDSASDSDSGESASESDSTSTSDTTGVSSAGTDTDPTTTTTTTTSTDSTGSTTDDTSSSGSTTDDTTSGSTTDATTTGDSDSDSGDLCIECGVTLNSTQSSSFSALPGTEFIGFATLEDDKVIYALDEVGSGRVVYTADTNILYKEITDCPLWEWLGDSGDQLPKVLSFGRNLCGGLGNNLGDYPDLTYAGSSLPPQYVGDPAKLAADYDMVIYCTIAATSDAEAQTIVDFVKDEGGGLYLASEYFGFLKQADVDRINTIGNPLGVEFETTNLDWGQANGEIGFDCFPLPQ